MPIHRLIFRFDFPTNFDLLDNPGTIMRMLAEHTADGFWDDIREKREKRQIFATKKEVGHHRILSVEPVAIYGAIESLEGWSIEQLTDRNPEIRKMIDIARGVCERFKIKDYTRAGLRLFYFGSPLKSVDLVYRAFRSFTREDVIQSIENKLGGITDYSLIFDGSNEDKIQYHLRAGPFSTNESARYFNEINGEFVVREDYNFVTDLDLYENDFSLSSTVMWKWFLPLFARANNVFKELETLSFKGVG